MTRWAPRLLAALAVLACGYAAYLATKSGEPEAAPAPQAARVADTDRDLGDVPANTVRDVAFVITNPTSKPVRVVGSSGKCGYNCCFTMKHLEGEQVVVPPGGTANYVYEVSVRGPGPFDIDSELFLDDDGLRAVPLKVRGTVVEAGGKGDAKNQP